MMKSESNNPQFSSITSLLTDHVDEICDFHSYCSFFCDAVIAMAYRDEPMNYETAEGITLFTSWLKQKHDNIKERAKATHQLSRDIDMKGCCNQTPSNFSI